MPKLTHRDADKMIVLVEHRLFVLEERMKNDPYFDKEEIFVAVQRLQTDMSVVKKLSPYAPGEQLPLDIQKELNEAIEYRANWTKSL